MVANLKMIAKMGKILIDSNYCAFLQSNLNIVNFLLMTQMGMIPFVAPLLALFFNPANLIFLLAEDAPCAPANLDWSCCTYSSPCADGEGGKLYLTRL